MIKHSTVSFVLVLVSACLSQASALAGVTLRRPDGAAGGGTSVSRSVLARLAKGLGAGSEADRRKAASEVSRITRTLCEDGNTNGLRIVSQVCGDALDLARTGDVRDDVLLCRVIETLSYLAPVDERALEILEACSDVKAERRPSLEKAALAILRLDRKDTVVGLLVPALRDAKASIRTQSAIFLGKLACPNSKVTESLLASLRDKDWEVVAAAAEAIGEIAYRNLGKTGLPTKDVVPELVKLLTKGKNDGECWAAAQALGDIGPAAMAAIPMLKKRIERNKAAMASAYALARISPEIGTGVDILIGLVKRPGFNVPIQACILLGRIGGPARRAAPAIRKHIRDDIRWVARIKQETLARIEAGTD